MKTTFSVSSFFAFAAIALALLGVLATPTNVLLAQEPFPGVHLDCSKASCDNGTGGCTQSCESQRCDDNMFHACHSGNLTVPCACN